MQRDCESCGAEFTAKRSTARFCTATCRSRAARAAKAAASAAELEASAAEAQADELKSDGPAEHELVRAVRKALADADALGTVAGQLALQMARRIAAPDAPGVSTLSKELRSLLAEATCAPAPAAGREPVPDAEPDDELDEIRRRREEARQAAGLA